MRHTLWQMICVWILAVGVAQPCRPAEIDRAVQGAHSELWRRFIDPESHIFYDHADLDGKVVLPTPEECTANKPNALSWDISVTDGSMFGGMYMEAAINRWKITADPGDREKVRRIARGLMKLASVGKTEGFLARGVATDGSAHYPLSSNDQAMPWLYGMWRYVGSGIPDGGEIGEAKAKIMEVMGALRLHGWRVPADRPPFDYFGEFASFGWQGASRLLFLLKMAAHVSGEKEWDDLYRRAMIEAGRPGKPNRLALCEKGMISARASYHTWTHGPGVTGLRGLWEMEDDPRLKDIYARGLAASAAVAAESLSLAEEFDNDDRRHFLLDWRPLNALWSPQNSVREAIDLAKKQLELLDSMSPRRVYEVRYMREPIFAAWVISLCPDPSILRQYAPAILRVIRHYRYERLYTSQFFPAESAYYRLRLSGVATD